MVPWQQCCLIFTVISSICASNSSPPASWHRSSDSGLLQPPRAWQREMMKVCRKKGNTGSQFEPLLSTNISFISDFRCCATKDFLPVPLVFLSRHVRRPLEPVRTTLDVTLLVCRWFTVATLPSAPQIHTFTELADSPGFAAGNSD